jgi:hypothetical protein
MIGQFQQMPKRDKDEEKKNYDQNGYGIYVGSRWQELKEEPQQSFGAIAKQIAHEWHQLTEDERNIWEATNEYYKAELEAHESEVKHREKCNKKYEILKKAQLKITPSQDHA